MLKQAETPDASPEELLRFCDREILRRRAARKSNGHRVLLIGGALLLMIIVATGSLMILFSMLRDLPRKENAMQPQRFRGSAAVVYSLPRLGHSLC